MSVYTRGYPARADDDLIYVPTFFNIVFYWPHSIDVDLVRAKRKEWQQEYDSLLAEKRHVNIEAARAYRLAAKDILRLKNACDIVLGWLEKGTPRMREWPVELAEEFNRVLGICEVK